ncbi:hypothetical protein P879_05294 [Paragonimus westermani]|uniref:Uncharacterized protein n=1 Tax=Paragonimus westermani TaxID=34504 RepID=A0A8T0DE97_9TREM|nr:hypothetical protein P879_05294 [Paragonimus westermani]
MYNLFALIYSPLSKSDFVREDTIRSDITTTDQPASSDSGTDSLMKYADWLMQQRVLNLAHCLPCRLSQRTIRRPEFQQIWDELPNYVNCLLHTVPT